MSELSNELTIERLASLLWVTLNRAAKANAMTVDMMEGMTAAIQAAADDAQVSAVMLSGSGERVFCAGVDIREQPADGDMARQRQRRSQALAALQDAVMDCPKPVVAVLNGTASGGGAMLALLADACVAVDTAKLSLPEIDLGIATFSGANILEVIGGRALALDLIQSGRAMRADEALARGLFCAVTLRDDLISKAVEAGEALGAKNPRTFNENKQWINRSLKAALSQARDEHARHRELARSES